MKELQHISKNSKASHKAITDKLAQEAEAKRLMKEEKTKVWKEGGFF